MLRTKLLVSLRGTTLPVGIGHFISVPREFPPPKIIFLIAHNFFSVCVQFYVINIINKSSKDKFVVCSILRKKGPNCTENRKIFVHNCDNLSFFCVWNCTQIVYNLAFLRQRKEDRKFKPIRLVNILFFKLPRLR
jgi:hypothetical protein